MAPRAASASAAGVSTPSSRTVPMPRNVWKACDSGMISPELPSPVRGIAGVKPSFRRSTRNCTRSGLTPDHGRRKSRSRTTSSARTSSGGNHGGPPTARPISRLRWCSACCRASSATPARRPIPVLTPYTGFSPFRRAVKTSSRRAFRASTSGLVRTNRSPSAKSLPVTIIGTAAWCRRRKPRHGPGSCSPPRRPLWTVRGARTGSARRRARGRASCPPRCRRSRRGPRPR